MESVFNQLSDYILNLNFEKLTLMSCFVVQGHPYLHLVILQTLLYKATYNWVIHKAIPLEEANRQRKCPKHQVSGIVQISTR